MIGIEARGSPLLHKGGFEGVPDQESVVVTVPNGTLGSWEMAV